MPACPNCHIYKGLWSPMAQNDKGEFICSVNNSHKYTRDREGNFHSLA